MPSTTPNYGLHTFNLLPAGDKLESFQNFRDLIAGVGTNSNMYIIDGKLKEWRDDIDALEARQGVIRVPMVKDSANHYSASGISGISLTYPVGMTIVAIPDTTNDGTTVLNINSIGDVAMVKIDEVGAVINLAAGDLAESKLYLFVYDGTNLVWVSPNTLDQIFAEGNSGELIRINTNNNLESSGVTIDTATDLGGGSPVNTKLSTQLAVKTYVDALISNANALVYKGVIDCSSNPDYPAADAGWLYIVSLSGKIGGASGIAVEAGDMAICKVDGSPSGNEATVGANWNIIQKNIDGYVIGISSSTDGGMVVFDGASGRAIKAGALPTTSGQLLRANGTSWVGVSSQTVLSDAILGATAKTTLSDNDNIPITDSDAGNILKYIIWSNFKTAIINAFGAMISSLSSKATPVDADEVVMSDSAASSATKRVTFANLKLFFKTYYDSVTATLTNKTLTSPIISTISNTGVLTLPTSTDTLIGRATTDTLTNKRVNPRVTTITSSATPTINTDDCDAVTITALATAITSFTTNLSGTPVNFQKLTIRIKDNGTARSITWGASFEAKGVSLPTTTVISKVLTVGFIYDSVTAKWGCVAVAQEI